MISSIVNTYNWAMENASDTRTSDWFLIGSPWPMLALTVLYLVVVNQGQKFMADKQPLSLKPLLIVYNFLLVLLSAYMFWEFFATSVLEVGNGFNLICQAVDYSDNPAAVRLASVCWWYFFSKIIEYLDTTFFVLRKKNNQISFLHVYHHSSMVILWWIGVRFTAGGGAYFSAMINCAIHVLMYTYYLLSAFGQRFQKYLWWKKYMTSLQLIQFVVIMIHTCNGMYVNCGFPRAYMVALALYMVSHILLFSNFYYHTYKKVPAVKRHQNGVTSNKVD